MKTLSVDLSLFGKQPFGQLLFGHLEAEDRNRLLAFESRAQTDVESERGVVQDDVLSHEVVCLWDRQVINLMFAIRLDRNDFFPVDLLASHLPRSIIVTNGRF